MAKAKASDKVSIRLVAMGELSPVTGGVLFHTGDTVEVPKEVAAAAVATGRWEAADAPKPNEDGAGEGA